VTPSIAFGAHHRQPLWQSRFAKSVCKFCIIVRPDRARGPLHGRLAEGRGRDQAAEFRHQPALRIRRAQVADVGYPAVIRPYGRSRDGRAGASPGGWWSCCRVCTLSLSQIRSGCIGGAVRRDEALRRSSRRLELRAGSVRPCPATDTSRPRCKMAYTRTAGAEGDAHQVPRHG
jgi:hypothetical protein